MPASAMSKSMSTSRWSIPTSTCTTSTTSMRTGPPRTAASHTATSIGIPPCGTVIRTIPTCIIATAIEQREALHSRLQKTGESMKILGISGSLRKASFNTAALRACRELMPQGMTLEIAEIGDIPMFNQDIFDAGLPAPAKRFRDALTAADGVLIASPEYNFSLTAALKNAIDWASRPPNQSWQDKPVAGFSASAGPLGGARVQYDIRRILGQL